MDFERIYEWQHVVIGVVGLAVTAAVTGPGEHSIAVGPLGFDPFYVTVGCFAALVCWSGHTLWQLRSEE